MGQTAAKKAMDKVTTVPDVAGELKRQVDPAKVNIWERRMINPGSESAAPIVLKEEGWTLRYVNTSVEGRFHRAVYVQGWTPVTKDELRDSPELLGLAESTDNLVRRGERGVEVLMKIPTVVFERITREKARRELESIKKTREQLANAMASRFGSNAGDWAFGQGVDDGISGLRGKVVDSKERMVVDLDQDGE